MVFTRQLRKDREENMKLARAKQAAEDNVQRISKDKEGLQMLNKRQAKEI